MMDMDPLTAIAERRIQEAMKGHILEKAELIGLYRRN